MKKQRVVRGIPFEEGPGNVCRPRLCRQRQHAGEGRTGRQKSARSSSGGLTQAAGRDALLTTLRQKH